MKNIKVELSAEDRAIVRKQTKRIIIMGAVLILLIAAYFILTQIAKKKASEPEETGESKVFLTTDTDSITKFSYTYEGEEYAFRKDGDSWIYTGDETMDMDEDLVGALLKNLAAIEYGSLISGATDLDQYGLAEGYETVKWTNADGNFEIRIGGFNPVTSEHYIEDAGNGDICTVQYSFIGKYRQRPDELKATAVEEATDEN